MRRAGSGAATLLTRWPTLDNWIQNTSAQGPHDGSDVAVILHGERKNITPLSSYSSSSPTIGKEARPQLPLSSHPGDDPLGREKISGAGSGRKIPQRIEEKRVEAKGNDSRGKETRAKARTGKEGVFQRKERVAPLGGLQGGVREEARASLPPSLPPLPTTQDRVETHPLEPFRQTLRSGKANRPDTLKDVLPQRSTLKGRERLHRRILTIRRPLPASAELVRALL